MPFQTKTYSRKTSSPNPHRHKADRERRGSSSARGYNSRWQKYVKGFLGKTRGRRRPCIACVDDFQDSVLVDHIIPVRQDADTPAISAGRDSLFWSQANHEPLCRGCHQYKTHQFDPWFTENRPRLERVMREKESEGGEPWEIRNWLLSEGGVWVKGWFDLNPDPEFEMRVLTLEK